MAKKRKKTIKIEITVPEFFYRLRKPQATDVEKIKASLPRNEKMTRFVRENNKLVCVAVVVIAAIIVVSFMFLANYQLPAEPEEGYVPQKVNRTKTVTVTVPVNMSFEEYLENSVNYEDEIVTVTGFLKNDIMWAKGAGGLGTYIYSVVDDFEKEINLTGLTARHKSLFVQEGITEELFNVTGQVKLKYMGFDLEVSSIVLTQRPTTEMEKQIIVEEYV